MRSDFPDYKTPIFAYFRGLALWVITAAVGGVILVLAYRQFRLSVWVGRGFLIAVALAGVANVFVFMHAFGREERRAQNAATAARPSPTPSAASMAWVGGLRILALVGAVIGLPVLIAGLIAKLALMATIGGALFAVTLLDVSLINPGLQAHHDRLRRR